MASRAQQDTFIVDEEETCPLCVEEFDLSDRNFRPCPCGFQICQFCCNKIRTNGSGSCPACRRPYDDKSIEWKFISPEEFKADLQKQARKKEELKRKEAQKREFESLNRKHLSGLRVVQKNLVYVVGLNPRIREEDLLATLRGDQYFGQYGKIIKIVVSKPKDGSRDNQSLGVYVTFERKEDAENCIRAVDGSKNGERTLRAQFGTTKYCSAYLRNEQCPNKTCMFLHEPGEDKDSFTREDLSSKNAESTQTSGGSTAPAAGPSRSIQAQTSAAFQKAPLPVAAAAESSGRHHSQGTSGSVEEEDGSALPSSASWANKGQQTQRSGSSSQANTSNAASPAFQNASISIQKQPATSTSMAPSQSDRSSVDTQSKPSTTATAPTKRLPQEPSKPHLLDEVLKAVQSPAFRITFNESLFSEEEYQQILSFPPLFDDDGGKKRRAMRNREEEERAAHTEDLASSGLDLDNEAEEEPLSGSLQLGGEPEPDQIGRDQRQVFPPSMGGAFPQQSSSLSNLSINGRGLTKLQQQQLQILKDGSFPNSLMDQFGSGASGSSGLNQSHIPSGLFPSQSQGHARQASRYSFANDSSASTTIKPSANPKAMAQQSSMMPPSNANNQAFHSQHQQLAGNQPFSSGPQGPPPGLKASGTPPISGGGMFGQGHGFTSTMGRNAGFGTRNTGEKESNNELLRDLLHGRGGASTSGASQTSDAAKHFQLEAGEALRLVDTLVSEDAGGSSASVTVAAVPGLDHLAEAPPGLNVTVGQQLPIQSTKTAKAFSVSNPSNKSLPDVAEANLPAIYQRKSRAALLESGFSLAQTSSLQDIAQTIPVATPFITRPGDVSKEEFPALASPAAANVRQPAQTPVGSKKFTTSKAPSKLKESEFNDPKFGTIQNNAGLQQAGNSRVTDESGHPDSFEILSSKADISDANKQTKKKNLSQDLAELDSKKVVPESAEGSQSSRPAVIRVLPTAQSSLKRVSTPPLKPIQIGQVSVAHRPSRQASTSSLKHPGTPTSEIISDALSSTSASASRASSPQPSKIGSMPVRHVTKSQLKKQRKEAKKEQERREVEPSSTVSFTTPKEQEQAPIVGRKKKKAKQVSILADDSTPGPSRQQTPEPQLKDPIKVQKAATKVQKPETRPRSDTARNAEKAEKAGAVGKSEILETPPTTKPPLIPSTPTTPKETLPKQFSNAAKILSEMQASGELDAGALGFFDYVEGLNHKHNISSIEAQDWEHKFMVSADHEKDLVNGSSLHGVIGTSGQLSSRVMISPAGWFLRGLPQEREERFEEIEHRCRNASRPGSWVPDRQTGPSSFEIISGRFIQSGPRAAPGNAAAITDPLSKMRIEEALNYINQFVATTPLDSDVDNGSVENARRFLPNEDNGEAPEPSRYTPYYEQSFATELNRDVADLLDSMDGDDGELEDDGHRGRDGGRPFQLQLPKMPLMSVEDAERAMLVSRKETEAWEKKLLGIMRRNKKILGGPEAVA